MYFDKTTLAVDERQHGDVLHIQLAVSIRQLQDVIIIETEEQVSRLSTSYTFAGVDTPTVLAG